MRKPLHAFAALAAAALALQPMATHAEGTTASADIATQCLPCVELPKGDLTDAQLRELVPDDAPGRVFIRWRTETQEDNYGFNIHRAAQPGGPSEKVNKSIIPGEGSTNIPKEYCYMDVRRPARLGLVLLHRVGDQPGRARDGRGYEGHQSNSEDGCGGA